MIAGEDIKEDDYIEIIGNEVYKSTTVWNKTEEQLVKDFATRDYAKGIIIK